ncbi:MAG TPA: 4'-phosphopantetheinyl transferase superfamily protein [Cellvibrionaceae bacterium]|nr:4'-phosphopantetheinyl transferase superfamily protein [Cellvibrionaceae bacterium]HMY37688.1 4'-phosphopantetheinyl transferase superfamily protein [Marinagarivorans sp.]HNG58833.1 4'-phosphopantetheinyl transferase superfamily protein [Cellvibrionaceae bacterium]
MRIIDMYVCRLAEFSDLDGEVAAQFLDVQEHARFSRFKFDRHRQAFLASRVLQKTALAQRLKCPIADLAFDFGPQGKPALQRGINPGGVEFNLTHSDTWALLAVDQYPLGIDTENMQRNTNILSIARHNFHPREIAFLTAQAAEPQWGFYYWMLKEAYIKYLGTGLSQSLKEFYFTWQPLQFGSETPLPVPAACVFNWAADAVAALCYQPGEVHLRLQQLSPQGTWTPLEIQLLVQTQ